MNSKFHMSVPRDEATQATNDDASISKLGAIKLGYWSDIYLPTFIKSSERKTPEINRGYFARVYGIKMIMYQFLEIVQENYQVINLGAGFDTLYWRLKDDRKMARKYIEIDFPTVTAKKCRLIKKNKVLLEALNSDDGEVAFNPTDMHSLVYNILGCDLRNLECVKEKLKKTEVKFNTPTLVLSECVLVYLESEPCKHLLHWIGETFSNVLFVNYEMVNMTDKFSEIMIQNLSSRGCHLGSVDSCATLSTQRERFLSTGWVGSKSWTMSNVYNNLPAEEIKRIQKIEMLDEKELLDQLLDHYCICIAWKCEDTFGFENIDFG